ncbi:dual specificity protein phosphatase family protein [Pseudodesulfovibrio sp.]|uniref:dual specificity protein phosphatase family protein n=1 Tax=unclassified Pseudodesulfovibrio TaxID=2661612 RepID=UPI003AFF8B29
MTFRQKMTAYVVLGILGILAVTTWSYVWYIQEQGNFHTITPGEAYRSAQLDRDELKHYVHEHGIRSIINLRGKRPGKDWYRQEIATSRELGVRHFDYGGIGAVRPPTPKELAELLTLFASAPRPVLLHCQAGADRSGLAAAIWKEEIDGTTAAEARKQLSLRYGHMPVGPTQVLDEFFDAWASAEANGAAAKTVADKEN